MTTILRKAFVVTLKPGALERYVHWHDNLWPDLAAQFATSGIVEISLFEDDPLVFVYSEITAIDAWDRHFEADISQRWMREVMDPLMDVLADGSAKSADLREIWHFPAG